MVTGRYQYVGPAVYMWQLLIGNTCDGGGEANMAHLCSTPFCGCPDLLDIVRYVRVRLLIL